jgi:hypothetical protein
MDKEISGDTRLETRFTRVRSKMIEDSLTPKLLDFIWDYYWAKFILY